MGVCLWVGCVCVCEGRIYMYIWVGWLDVLDWCECIGRRGEEKLNHYLIFVIFSSLGHKTFYITTK